MIVLIFFPLLWSKTICHMKYVYVESKPKEEKLKMWQYQRQEPDFYFLNNLIKSITELQHSHENLNVKQETGAQLHQLYFVCHMNV